MRWLLLTFVSILAVANSAMGQVESPVTPDSNSQAPLNIAESSNVSDERAEKLMRAVAKSRDDLETGTVTISIAELDGEKFHQLLTFDLVRVQFVGQTESGKRTGEAAMWDGDAVTVVSRFGTEGVRIVNTGMTPTYLFDPRCIGIQGPLSQSSSVEDELSFAHAKRFDLVNEKEDVDGISTVVIRVHYADGFGEKEYYRQFWIADTEGHPVIKCRLVLKQQTYYESISTYSKESSVFPLPQSTVLTGFGANGEKLIQYNMTLSKANYNYELDKETFSYKSLGVLPNITVTDERIHRQIGIWDGNKLVPFSSK